MAVERIGADAPQQKPIKPSVGARFGLWLVLGQAPNRAEPSGRQRRYWLCRCDCETEREVCEDSLTYGAATNCGCVRAPRIKAGDTFGRLTIVGLAEPAGAAQQKKRMWHCVCRCGTPRTVSDTALRSGRTTSCGCFRREHLHYVNVTHGEGAKGRESAEYRTWLSLSQRCENPNDKAYRYYGGRGIRVCEQWRGETGFEQFLRDMGRRPSGRHSLDRVEVDGNYEPTNCRWATKSQQMRNKRDNRLVEFEGQTVPLVVAVEAYGADYQRVWRRLVVYGWTLKEALTAPVGARVKR